ncbi:1-deoxy-D-xylulose-5-phosphate synthase [Sulfurospirillum arcachonense]|uniref:1-deoxy-D-xylulose-5-phosphate synthase n=1 Tax=Sulfurospirillum arcachonense TaxID=57666 RepID=UPI0004685020|nr:1-deoxy-D-xylulose-5-phosphate synthase [Sulfurospirillum arcachonense]
MIEVKGKSVEELKDICVSLRKKIIETVSKNGGHLSSNVGAVELIVAMHYVFDAKKDPFIFDVSHQSYAHKLLTDRWDKFDTLREFNGICGYTKPSESQYDYFVAGHSSTSISLALGAAKAISLKKEQDSRRPIALIGDGSMTAGMAYEALNELGDIKLPVIIILNDNKMSIAKPIGAISKFLSHAIAGDFFQKVKKRTEHFLQYLPDSATYMAKKFEESLKLITPGMLFEELGIDYIGPVDGHNVEELIKAYELAKKMKKPVIIHAQTLKGKGYQIAEGYEENWHGVGPFDIDSGKSIKSAGKKNATSIYSDALSQLAKKYENVVGVTAAMPTGTGLSRLINEFPNRFWDVAIAEQHAVTSMSAMAKEGFKPFITIYSTFLQRAYDQVIHDACIMNLNVVFALDRAGIVGEDGETHQGAFDISYLSAIPNMTIFAPRDNASMYQAVEYAYKHEGPCAIRYPRGAFFECENVEDVPFRLGKSQLLKEGKSKVLLIGYGNGVGRALNVSKILEKTGIDCAVLDLRFVKPMDKDMLEKLSKSYNHWFIISDSAKMGGVGSQIAYLKNDYTWDNVKVISFEYEDDFIKHGNTTLVEEDLGILAEQLAKKILKSIK